MISPEEFRTLLCSLTMELRPESVPLCDAAGRFPTEPIASPIDLPSEEGSVGKGRYLRAGVDFIPCGRLGSAEIASLAAAGISRVMVRRVINAGFLTVEKGAFSSENVRDFRGTGSPEGYMLSALLKETGAWPVDYGAYPEGDKVVEAMEQGLAECSVFIALGPDPEDVRDFFTAPGRELLCDGVDVQAGEKLLFGRVADDEGTAAGFVFSFPQGAVPSFLFFHLFVRPFLYGLNGGCDPGIRLRCALSRDLDYVAGSSAELAPVRLIPGPECSLLAEPLDVEGPDHVTGLIGADGCVLLGAGSVKYAAGTRVNVLLFR